MVIAISPMETSARFQTNGSEATEPNITIASTDRRKTSNPAAWLCSRNTRQFSA
ncbi:hypothetical protein D9M71_668540 [compost metagenome]